MSTATTPRLRVMLLEDHVLVRHGMELLLQAFGIEVAGSFCTPQELFMALKQQCPDVIVTDYALGAADVDGQRLIRRLRQAYPTLRILVVTSHGNAATMALAKRAGAHGFIAKTEHEAKLLLALRAVAAGRTYFSRALADAAGKPGQAVDSEPLDYRKLSAREQEVLRCMLEGLSISAIARKFSRSITTISVQKRSAFRKLGIVTNHELFKLRYQQGIGA